MESNWSSSTLADISSDVSYGYTESASIEKVGPRFLRITDIQGGVVDWATVPYCPISKDNHRKYRLQEGDIVVARTGNSTGENYLFYGSEDAVFASYLIRFRINKALADPRFIWYNLRTTNWWGFINSAKTGSAQSGANARILGQFPIELPPLPEQRAIAAILGALDDKIELNRRMNATLEGIARALFKSWFVDFDPVRAKAEGRRMKDEIAALFPDALVDSELGEIPRGWKMAGLHTVATLKKEAVQPMRSPAKLWEHYSIPAFDTGRIPVIEAGTNIKSGKYRVPPTSVLVSKLNPQFPRIWLPDVQNEEAAICSTEFMPFVPLRCNWRPFVYELMKSDSVQQGIHERVTGSTGSRQRAKPEDVAAMYVVMPIPALIEAFSHIVGPLHEKMLICINESRTLAALRDTLLPKLLSGELRVPDAERLCAEGGL